MNNERDNELFEEDSSTYMGEYNEGGSVIYDTNISSPSNNETIELVLDDTFKEKISAEISFLNHTNYIICFLLLTIFLFLFITKLFERK